MFFMRHIFKPLEIATHSNCNKAQVQNKTVLEKPVSNWSKWDKWRDDSTVSDWNGAELWRHGCDVCVNSLARRRESDKVESSSQVVSVLRKMSRNCFKYSFVFYHSITSRPDKTAWLSLLPNMGSSDPQQDRDSSSHSHWHSGGVFHCVGIDIKNKNLCINQLIFLTAPNDTICLIFLKSHNKRISQNDRLFIFNSHISISTSKSQIIISHFDEK